MRLPASEFTKTRAESFPCARQRNCASWSFSLMVADGHNALSAESNRIESNHSLG